MATAPTIGAIPTIYKGVKFRSKTEARWAVFFTALGIRWEFEPEGYSDGTYHYLPDFWLPDHECFWEVKGEDGYDSEKIGMVARVTKKLVYVAIGQPQEPIDENGPFQIKDHGCPGLSVLWAECVSCNRVGLVRFFRINELVVVDTEQWPFSGCQCGASQIEARTPRLLSAFVNARSYRFWEPNR